MGQYLGKLGNYAVGNYGGRFAGRRMFKSDIGTINQRLADQAYFSGDTSSMARAQAMATWAAAIYQFNFGESPGKYSPTVEGWETFSEYSDANSGFDALGFERGDRTLIVLEGSTSGKDWLLNVGTGAIGNDTQMQAAYDYGRNLAQSGKLAGQTIDLTGQSLGAGLLPLVAAGMLSVDPNLNVNAITGFSTPQFGEEINGFLKSGFNGQQRLSDDLIAQLEEATENYAFDGDAVYLPGGGDVFGGRVNIVGKLFYENYSSLNGEYAPTLVNDGVLLHSASLMDQILNMLPAGFVDNGGSGQTFVIDQFGRVSGFRLGEPAPDADVEHTQGFGVFQTDANKFFASAFLPDNTQGEIHLMTVSDGTVFVGYETPNEQVSLVYNVILDDNGNEIVVALKETFYKNGQTETVWLQGEVPDTIDGETAPTLVREVDAETAKLVASQLNTRPLEFGPMFATIGSSIGNYLGGEDPLARVVSSSLLSTIALNIGQAISFGDVLGAQTVNNKLDGWFDNFGGELAEAFGQAAIGSVSSFMSMELADSLGLEGFGAELFSTTSSTVFSQVMENARQLNLNNLFEGINTTNAIGNVAQVGETVKWNPGFLASAVGAFFGTKLAQQVVSVNTEAAGILSSVGSAAGAYMFGVGAASSGVIGTFAAGIASKLGTLGNFVVPGVGAFIGYVLGALIGNLFGSQKPRIPTADAETVLNFASGYYQVGQVTSKNGGNEALVRDMSEAARDTLNGLIGLITHGSDVAGNANLVSPTQVYGHTAGELWVKLGGTSSTKRMFERADQAVDYGALWAIRQTKIAGGDLHLKRALLNSSASSVVALSGDLQIAEDYAFYLQNQEVINAAIAEPYDSLSSADKAFYNANAHLDSGAVQNSNESRITRIMAAPRDSNGNILNDGSALALNTVDQNWYNAHKATVDRIVEGLQVTQFAAGWIVTLQRAAELGLNKTSRSDFYGGLAGFADSLKLLANTDFEYEDMRLSLIGDTLRIGHAEFENLLENPSAGGARKRLVGELPQGWSFWTNDPDGGYSYGVNTISGPEWHADLPEGTMVVHQQDGQQGYVQDLGADFEATGGKVYTASVYTGAHRADIELLILWFGANGETEWAYENSPDRKNRREAYGGDHLSGYKLIKTTNTAPDWAVSGRLVLRKRSTAVGEVDSWMFATRPQVTEGGSVAPWSLTATEFSVPESWDVEDFFASGGYSKMVGGKPKASGKAARALRDMARDSGHTITHSSLSVTANTGLDSSDGNDFYQHASAHAVSLDDLRTETVRMTYEYSFYHNPYEPDIGHGSLSTTVSVEGGDDIFIGNVGNDTLRGRSGFDWLDGGGGEDVIYGGDDDDVILGGDGTDRLYGENGDDYIHPGDGHNYYKNVNGIWTAFGAWGGHGNDTIVASGTRAYIDAQGDDDTVIVTQSITAWSRYNGGAGIDTLSFERYSTAINLNIGALVDRGGGTGWRTFNSHEHFIGFENFTATEFNDTLTGDTGSNLLRGLAGDDVLSGHTGNDTLEGGAGADTLNGDAGTDAASYENSDFAVWVDLSNGESFGGDAEGDTFVSVEHLKGSDYDDTLTGDAQGNMLTGGKGDDWFVATEGGDIYAGGEDFDTVDYSNFTRAVTVNLGYTIGYPILSPIASQSTHRFAGIEHIVGSDFDDTIYGTALDNVFQGGKGNDILRGGVGLDTYIFHSGDGQDKISETLNNDGGWDTLMFGDGITWSSLNFAIVSNVAPVLGESNSSSRGDFRISVRGTSDKVEIYDNWLGSPNSNNGKLLAKIDTIDVGGVGGVDIRQIGGMALGTDNADHLYGDYRWNRHDMIFGYGGNDTIYAAGADRVDHHDNVMSGGRGNDTLYASNGDDTYIFERGDGIDTIIDSGGVDRIQFGPSIAADEVIFEIVGTDLYIGLRDPDDESKRASQVSDRMRITSISRSTKDTKIEHITAGGVDIALAELDLWAIDLLALPPTATDDHAATAYGTPVIVSAFMNDRADANGQSFSYLSHTDASHGSTSHLGNGAFRYTPNHGFSGTDQFTYTIRDEGGQRDTATVTITTAPAPPKPPRANDDYRVTPFQTAVETNVFGNDQRDAYNQAFSYHSHTGASHGSVNHLGNGVFRYTPNNGFSGIDRFTYTIRDTGGQYDSATVSMDVGAPANNAPLAGNDSGTISDVYRNTTLNVLANDTDPDGHSLRIDRINGQVATVGTILYTPVGNQVRLNANGTISYYGAGYPAGWDHFTYRVNDGHGGYDTATISVLIQEKRGHPGGDPGSTFLLPIILDLDGDGADLVSVMRSRVVFENDGGGPLWRAGWVAPEDGFLALDRDGDGVINRLSEISFLDDYEGATTDLEGLRGFDSNQDGVFDRLDDQWSAFLVWQDVNQNGIGTGSELMSLEEAGIVSISLALTDLGNDLNGNRESTLLNEAAFTFADQRVHKAYDVALNIQIAHIQGTSNADLTNVFEGSEWRSDGAFGVAYNAQPGGPDWDENATAPLQTIDGGRLGVDESIPLQTLWRHVDADDSMAPVPQSQPDANTDAPPSYGVKPLVIDMDGDGLELINPYHSPIEIDGDGDGAHDRMGWVSSDDAFLALDRNGDQMISAPSEILFDQDLPGAQTGVEGLRAYDSNGDAWLDAGDARFGEFMVWQDRNSDGLSTSDELRSLTDVGIRRIALTRQDDTFSSDGPLGNTVFGQAALIWEDGRTGMIGDVELRALSGNLEEQKITEQMRLERQRVGLGAWDFDRDARRAALDDLRAQDFNATDQTRSLTSPGREISPFADGERMTGSADDRDRFSVFEGRPRQTFVPSGNGAVAAFDAADSAPKELSPHAPSGRIRPETGDRQGHNRRWWSEPDLQHNPTEHGAASLSQLLAGFDAARDRFNAATPTLPVESAETLAERQRFLQAVASFRGSSGVATPRRMSDRAYSHDAMIGASSIVRNGAHNMTVA
ncbi:MAG: Ig-like domain-containing protein [Pseudomonadota bacterium]